MKKIVLVLIILVVVSALYSEQLSDTSFDITAFKRGGIPKTIINVYTGVSDSFSYTSEDGSSGPSQSSVFDITAIAAKGSNTVADAIIIEYITNKKTTLVITLEFTPFKSYSYNGDVPVLDNNSNWKDANYYSPNPDSGSNDFIGSAENCLYEGEYYNYYSKLTTANKQYETSDVLDLKAKSDGNSNVTISLTNKVIAEKGGQSSDILVNNHNSTLPGIGTKMLTSKRVFSLKDINFNNLTGGKDYISTVTITIGAN